MTQRSRFPRIFFKALKIMGIVAVIVLLLFAVASWIVFEKKNDWLLSQVQAYMLASQSGQLYVASVDLKLFRSFPDITLVMKGISYYEHRDSLRTPQEKPILHAEQLFVAVELLPLMNEELNVTEISISKGDIVIIEYPNGKFNIEMALANPVKPKAVPKKAPAKKKTAPSKKTHAKKPALPKPKPAAVKFDLGFIEVHDFTIAWRIQGASDTSIVVLRDFEAETTRDDSVLSAAVSIVCDAQSLYLKNIALPSGTLSLNTSLLYDESTQTLIVSQSEVKFNEFSATMQGSYAHRQNSKLDITIDASSNDLKVLSAVIRPKVMNQNPNLLRDVDIYVKGKIFGELRNHPPQLDVTFGLRNLTLRLPRNLGVFSKVGFEGSFRSGSKFDYSQAILEIRRLRGQLPGGFLRGRFSLKNLIDPYVKYDLQAQLKLDGYDEVFKIDFLKQLTGSVSVAANFDGPLKYFSQHSMDSSRSSSLTLNNLSFQVSETNTQVTNLSGTIENKNNQAMLRDVGFSYGRNDLKLNATVHNLVYFFVEGDTDIRAVGNLRAAQLFTNDFLFDTTSNAAIQDRITKLSLDFDVRTSPNKILRTSAIPDVTFDIQKLSATLDELPDIGMVKAKGTFVQRKEGLKLDLSEFHATMPQGKLDVTGDLLIRSRVLWSFNARANANKFPWHYISELAAEIDPSGEPNKKNLPVKEMDLLTTQLDVSAEIITYPFDFKKLSIRDSKVHFDLADKKKLSVGKLNVSLDELAFIHPKNTGYIAGLRSTKGTVKLKQLRVPGLNPLDVDLNLSGINDSLSIAFTVPSQTLKKESGNLFMNIARDDRAYRLQYRVEGARVEYFLKKYYKQDFMKGELDYALDIHSRGADWTALKQNAFGEINITGDSLDLSGVNIDKVLKKFERSQNFDLADLGAVLVAGPVGLAVTKGSDFVSLATVNLNPKDHTHIQTMRAKWRLEDRQLIAEDVAFATSQNRIAFQGRIDIARDSIPGLTIAVVDRNGCALMDQKLYGKTSDLKTGKLNITKTIFGSVINFVNAIVGKDCKPVYTGIVKHPTGK
jgi:hypothetical protein